MTSPINVAVVQVGLWWQVAQQRRDPFLGEVFRSYTTREGWVKQFCMVGNCLLLSHEPRDQYASPQAAINAARHDGFTVVNAVRS
jgi:hypothetical protein